MASLKNSALSIGNIALPPNIWAKKMYALLAKRLIHKQMRQLFKLPAQFFGIGFLWIRHAMRSQN
jgi:hypothetical protein